MMKKMILKIFSLVVIVTMLSVQVSTVFAASTSELQNQKSENNKKIDEKQSDLNDVKEEKSQTQEQVNDLSTKISDFQSQIDELDSKIDNLNQQISDSQAKLDEKQKDYSKQQELLNERLVTMQESGDTSYLDFILNSSSFTDLISNYYLASEVANADTELLTSIQQEKKEIEDAKASLESSKRDLDTSKSEKQGITTQLQVAKEQKNAQVEKLSEDQKQIEEELDELQEANVQIGKEIKEAQAKYAAQIAALSKKASSSSSGKSGSSSGGSSSSSGGTYSGGGSGVLARPVASGAISAGMYYPSGSYHGAIDYAVGAGTPVYAAADGVVIKTANLTTSYGTYVVIQHANGLQTWYAHGTPGSICVSAGQTVSRGQQIMNSGNSGHSTGAHLHFEVRVAPYDYNSCRVNPANYM